MDGVVIRTCLGLTALAALAGTAAAWPWGVATLLWVGYTIYYGTTYVVEPIEREKYPRLYWMVTIIWTSVSIGLIAWDGRRVF